MSALAAPSLTLGMRDCEFYILRAHGAWLFSQSAKL
jgi:hypothetical protein